MLSLVLYGILLLTFLTASVQQLYNWLIVAHNHKSPHNRLITFSDLANRWILRNERDRLGGNLSSTNGLRDPKFVVEGERNSTDAVFVSTAEVDHKLEATTAKLDPKYGDDVELDGISSFGGFYSSDEFSPQNQTVTKRLRRQIGAESTFLAKNSVQDGFRLTDNNVSDFLLLPPLIDIWNSSKNLNETDHNVSF